MVLWKNRALLACRHGPELTGVCAAESIKQRKLGHVCHPPDNIGN